MIKICSAISLLSLFSIAIQAQSFSPFILATQGDKNQNGEYILEWTLGETFVKTVHVQSQGQIFTEGFHQPFLYIQDISLRNFEASKEHITIYPNPTNSFITIDFEIKPEYEVSIDLYDFKGNQIKELNLEHRLSSIQLNMVDLPSGIYILQLYDDESALLKSYKVSKL